jgi:endonuclease YncB( thermonuclease family)
MGSCYPKPAKEENQPDASRNKDTDIQRQRHRLEAIDPKSVSKVPFQNQCILARIEEIYDGDTVKIIILSGDVPIRLGLRILGIDTPEIKHGQDRLPQEHAAAIRVRDHLKSMFSNNIAQIRIHDWDKYGGRVLGDLFLPSGENVSDILIQGRWARPYHGEKKKAWTLEELTSKPFVS